MTLLTRKRAILAAIEAIYGEDAVPTGDANAILMGNLTVTPMKMTLVQRQNVKAYMGANPSVLAAIYSEVSFDVELAGSGIAGTRPAYGDLLRACGRSETILAAPVTGNATAGSATSITLAAGASAVNGVYVGMTIKITGGAGAGQSGVIAAYDGATKVATLTGPLGDAASGTSVYSIPAQVVYKPVQDDQESVTIYCNVDKVRHILLGARGTCSIKVNAQAIPMLSFTFTGLFVTPADVAIPAVNFGAYSEPLAVNAVNTHHPVIAGYAEGVVSDFSVDFANTVVFRSLVGGQENVRITNCESTGSVTFESTTVAAKDWWTHIKNVTLGVFSITHGTVLGNIAKIDGANTQLTEPAYGDKDGITMLTTKIGFIPATGSDELILSFQ